MGIDPKSLAAFAGPNQGVRKDVEATPASSETDTEEADAADPVSDDGDFQEYGNGRYSDLVPLLEEHASEIEEEAAGMDADALTLLDEDMSDEDMGAIVASFKSMDRKLQNVMKDCCGNISLEDCIRLADHLEEDEMIQDQARVSGWLYRVGQTLTAEEP